VQFRDPAAEILIGGDSAARYAVMRALASQGPDDLRADTHDVDVVMLNGLVGRMDIVANGRSDAFHLMREPPHFLQPGRLAPAIFRGPTAQ
jgi:hypothetical protein